LIKYHNTLFFLYNKAERQLTLPVLLGRHHSNYFCRHGKNFKFVGQLGMPNSCKVSKYQFFRQDVLTLLPNICWKCVIWRIPSF